MTRRIILFSFFISFLPAASYSQTRYACFENEKNKNLKISVSFNKDNKALFVKYGGQKDSIRIYYSKIVKSKNDGIPAYYWAKTYLEKINGMITGEYTFTNAGTYQLDVTYSRKRDNKDFYFSIIEGTQGNDDPPFRLNPCF
ncbi:MAG: hypothetical protein ACKVOM_11260 [Ferruginibacter sp.]